MTILDVLRYSVTDIFDLEELDTLPADLFIDWVTDCSGKSRERIARSLALMDSKVCIGVTRKSMVRAMVEASVVSATDKRNSHKNTGWGELYKAKFTKRLREMIANYEPV